MTNSLYQRLGGAPAVDAAVDLLSKRVLCDERIRRFFADIDIFALRNKQRTLLTMMFGGPRILNGKDLKTVHAGLVKNGLNDSHFRAFAEDIRITLEEMKVAPELVDEVMAACKSSWSEIAGPG